MGHHELREEPAWPPDGWLITQHDPMAPSFPWFGDMSETGLLPRVSTSGVPTAGDADGWRPGPPQPAA
jgi:hypothetical protein